jgi:hypothetical protein
VEDADDIEQPEEELAMASLRPVNDALSGQVTRGKGTDRKGLALNDRPERSSTSAFPPSSTAARGERGLSTASSTSSLDELREGHYLTSPRSRLSSAASDCVSDGDMYEVEPVSFLLLLST